MSQPPSLAELPIALGYARHRDRYLVVAVGLQAFGVHSVMWLAFTIPIGFCCVVAALVSHGQALHARVMPRSALSKVGSFLLTFGLGGGAYASAVAGAAAIGTAVGHGFHRGRQIRVGGRVALPALEENSAWSARRPVHRGALGSIPPALRAPLARQWRENGKTEHASVAAFAQLSLDLMELGAPPDLLESTTRDAADEIRHGRLCFGLARALDDAADGPTTFPAANATRPGPSYERLATLSLFDGVLHEGLSARVLAKLAQRCTVPAVSSMLRELAADEGRHAAHAWDVVEFCAERGGPQVLAALEGAVSALPSTHESALPAAARDGSWEPFGIHGSALEAECYAATLSFVRNRVAALLDQGLRRAG